MDWAYRMIAAHKLDPLGLAVVMHLGWRDAPALRTDRGIARALSQHRSSVAKATAKLAKMGIIERRSGVWVSVETVRIVEESGSRRVDHSVGQRAENGADHSVGHGGPLSGPPKDHSVGHKRKENKEKGAGAIETGVSSARAPVARPVGGGSGFSRLSVHGKRRQRPAVAGADIAAAYAALADPATCDAEKAQIWDWLAKVQPSLKASAHADA